MADQDVTYRIIARDDATRVFASLSRQMTSTSRESGLLEKSLATLSAQKARAKDAADLLGASVGIHLPREIKKFISSTSLIGPALSSAFNASIFVGLGVALFDALKNIDQLTMKMVDWSGELRRGKEEVEKFNVVLLEHAARLKAVADATTLIGLSGSARTSAQIGILGGDLGEKISKRAQLVEELSGQRAIASGFFSRSPQDKERAKSRITEIETLLARLNIEITEGEAKLNQLETQLRFDKSEEGKKRLEELSRLIEEVGRVSREATLSARGLGSLFSGTPEIGGLSGATEEGLFGELRGIQREGMAEANREARALDKQRAEERYEIEREYYRRIAEFQGQQFEDWRRQYQTMIDGIRDGAGRVFDAMLTRGQSVFKSLSNFFESLFQTSLRKIFQNIAVLIFGGRQQGQSILGQIFSGVFPGLSSGGGGGASGGGGAGGASTTTSGIPFLSGKLGLFGTKPGQTGGLASFANSKAGQITGAGLMMGGSFLLGDALKQGGIRGMIEGAGGGAMMGFSVGGPIGAAIGAAAGFVAGMFGGGEKRRAEERARRARLQDAQLFDLPTGVERTLGIGGDLDVETDLMGRVRGIGRSARGVTVHIHDGAIRMIDGTHAREAGLTLANEVGRRLLMGDSLIADNVAFAAGAP